MSHQGMDLDTVRKIAHLARLDLQPEELRLFQDQLSLVLKSFEEISQIDTQGVEPLVTPVEIAERWRADEVEEGKAEVAKGIIEQAPAKTGHLFRVPPVV